MTLQLLGDPRLTKLASWWTPARFDMAIRLVVAKRTTHGGGATLERIALQMSSTTWSVTCYRTGERTPCGKSLWFIDRFLSSELGDLWMSDVDHELDESGRSQSRAPVRSAEGVF